jgi:hypothetical protein
LGRSAVKISSEKPTAQAEATGFRPDVLEKVAHLLGLREALGRHPFLKGKLELKGETALNWRDRFLLKGAMLYTLWYDAPYRPTGSSSCATTR